MQRRAQVMRLGGAPVAPEKICRARHFSQWAMPGAQSIRRFPPQSPQRMGLSGSAGAASRSASASACAVNAAGRIVTCAVYQDCQHARQAPRRSRRRVKRNGATPSRWVNCNVYYRYKRGARPIRAPRPTDQCPNDFTSSRLSPTPRTFLQIEKKFSKKIFQKIFQTP